MATPNETMSINRVIILGRLTREPELRTTPNGLSVASISIANNRKYKGKDGEVEEVTFVDVTAFGNQAKYAGEHLTKGRRVLVEGRLKTDQWEKDGRKHSKLSVIAESVTGLDQPQREASDTPRERPTYDPPRETQPRRQPVQQEIPTSPDDDIPF